MLNFPIAFLASPGGFVQKMAVPLRTDA